MKSILVILLLALPQALLAQTAAVSETVSNVKAKSSNFLSFYQYSYRSFTGDKVEFRFPEKLEVSLQFFALGYQLDESTKIGVAASYIKNEIVLLGGKPSPSPFAPTLPSVTAITEGMSDTYLGVYKTYKLNSSSELEAAFQASFPTGAYDLKDPMGAYISYPGQLGSGTLDAVPYVKYTRKAGSHKLSSIVQGKFRSGTNSVGYRLGDELRATAGYDYRIFKWLSASVSGYYKQWGNVVNSDIFIDHNDTVRTAARKKAAADAGGHGRPGPRPGTGAPKGAPKAAPPKTVDVFATKGSRFTGLVGLKSGIFLSKDLGGILEISKPVYNTQTGDLEGLSMEWVAKASFVARF